MRKAGALVAKCLDELTDIVKAGVPTSRIDDFVRDFAFSHGAYPATLMYRGYRYSTCTSINHVVCHGMPGDRALKEGDIVNIDVTFIVDGWYGDSSRMYVIGPIARKAERLIEVTYEAMMRGIAAVKPGATTGDIGHAIQSFVEPQGMSVVRDFCGHGLGRMFHDEPNIIHIGRPGEGVALKPGMFFTIEPMIKPGATTGDIGHAIQSFVEPQGMSVVRDFCGHGLGRMFHDEPNIIHIGRPGEGVTLQARHVLHHRADDQSRQAACEDPVRRLDRGDPRPLAVGAVRAFGRRDRQRRRDFHAVAAQRREAAGARHNWAGI